MGFTKAFPVRSDKSVYPKWEDVELSKDEEKSADDSARKQNLILMKECLEDAKILLAEPAFSENTVRVAIALFEKRASHVAYHKEELAQEIFKKKV
ncbi:MAG: hypothetical protein ABIA93_05820 [Candidatus Woesearchaeota archaeon]